MREAPKLISDHYRPRKQKEIGIILDLIDAWKDVGNSDGKSEGDFAINEFLFKYTKHGVEKSVRDFRKMSIEQKISWQKILHENGFRRLIFTMRNRHLLQEFEGKAHGWDKNSHPGLSLLLKHWKKQEKQANLPDRVLKILMANELTNRIDLITIARIEQIRRIRRGWKSGINTNLLVAEQLQYLAKKEWEDKKSKIDERGWFYSVPNDRLGAAIELQRALNLSRKGNYSETLKSVDIVSERMNDSREGDFQLKEVYEWWIDYVKLRVRRSLMLIDDVTESIDKMEEIQQSVGEDLRGYLEELRSTKAAAQSTEGPIVNTVYTHLLKYHEGLCKGLEKCEGQREKDWEYRLMYAITGSDNRKNHGTKINQIKINSLKDNLSTLDGIQLLRKVDSDFGNAYLLVSTIVQRNSHLAAIKLLLVAVDIFARIRKVLYQKPVAKYRHIPEVTGDSHRKGSALIINSKDLRELGDKVVPDLKEWKSGDRKKLRELRGVDGGSNAIDFCHDTNYKYAESFKARLVQLLEHIEFHMEILYHGEIKIKTFIQQCVKSLSDFQFTEINDGNSWKDARDLSSLGQLSHLCGSFVGLPSVAWEDRKVTQGKQLVLYGSISKEKSEHGFYVLQPEDPSGLIIDPEEELNPYVRPAGESNVVDQIPGQ